MNIEYYMKLPYTVEMVNNDDGSVFVSIKELKGCMSEGDTVEEALEMIEDAKQCWLEMAHDKGMNIPLPDSMNEKEYSGKLVLRLPKELHRRLAKNAEENNVSLNQYINYLLSSKNEIVDNQLKVIESLSQRIYEKGHSHYQMYAEREISFDDQYTYPILTSQGQRA